MSTVTAILPGVGIVKSEAAPLIHKPSIGFDGATTLDLNKTDTIELTISNMITEDFQRTSDAFSVDIEIRDLCDIALARTTVEYDEFVYGRHYTTLPFRLKQVLDEIPHDVHVLKVKARYNSAADYSSAWSNTAFLTIFGKGYPVPNNL
jgi:hypothetical protein